MTVVAAVDIGSNTTGLLVTDDSRTDLARIMTPTRLGLGVETSRRFHPDSVARTLDCLEQYAEILDRHGVERFRGVATSASRLAQDFPSFARSVRDILGRDVHLVDGLEEGRLAHIGAVSHLERDIRSGLDPNRRLVIDIGGGSTEFAIGGAGPDAVRSLEVGVVRLTERHLVSDPPQPEELVNAIAEVQDLVADAVRDVPSFAQASQVIGCSGTIISIASVEIGAFEVPNGFVLTRAAAEDVFRTLATESPADRVHNPGLDSRRADIIVAGCCILVGIMRSLELDSITVSLGNILDGICHELLSNP